MKNIYHFDVACLCEFIVSYPFTSNALFLDDFQLKANFKHSILVISFRFSNNQGDLLVIFFQNIVMIVECKQLQKIWCIIPENVFMQIKTPLHFSFPSKCF